MGVVKIEEFMEKILFCRKVKLITEKFEILGEYCSTEMRKTPYEDYFKNK